MGGKTDSRPPVHHRLRRRPEYPRHPQFSDGQMLFLANLLSKRNQHGTRAAGSPRSKTVIASYWRRRPGREQHPTLGHRERLAGGDRGAATQHVLQHRHRYHTSGSWTNRKSRNTARARSKLTTPPSGSNRCARTWARRTAKLADEDITRICDTFLKFEESGQSKIFPNAAFRPESHRRAPPCCALKASIWKAAYSPRRSYIAAQRRRQGRRSSSPVIKKIHKSGKAEPGSGLRGLFPGHHRRQEVV